MIKYKFGNIECKIDFKDFLCLTVNDIKRYKSEFKEFSDLYEFIEKNIKQITHIIFDGYEYFLKNGLLHNLFGPSIIKYTTDGYVQGTSMFFYIDGKLVQDDLRTIGRGCKNLEDFKTKNIFHYKEISNKKTEKDINTGLYYKRKEGIDYIIYPIDLNKKIRKQKLETLNVYR